MRSKVGDDKIRFDDKRNRKSIDYAVGFLLSGPRRLTTDLGEFTRLWFRSRGYKQILFGVPSIAFATIFLFVAYAGHSARDSDLVSKYRAAAAEAFDRGETKTAELWLRKVSHLDKHDPETQYQLAITAAKRGDYDRANRTMQRIAPDDAGGYPPSHLWRARHLLQSFDQSDKQQASVIRHHLSVALEHDGNNLVAREQIAKLELSQADLPAAIEHYSQLESANPSFAFLLAKLYVLQGDDNTASRIADNGIDHFRSEVESNSGNVDARIQWARLEGFQERFDRSTQLLIDGVNLQSSVSKEDANRLRIEVGNAFYGWAELVRRTNPDDVAQRLKHLQLALKFIPDSSPVLEALAQLSRVDSPEATAAYESLSDSLVDGTATPMVHLVLAIAAFERGEFRHERQHLELALSEDPSLAVAANNLAWRLAVGDPPQLDRAFELINRTVEQSPNRPEFRATRGRIHSLLGNTKEAILDLEAALTRLNDRPDINDALGGLYKRIGDDDLTRLHSARAAQVRSEPGRPNN